MVYLDYPITVLTLKRCSRMVPKIQEMYDAIKRDGMKEPLIVRENLKTGETEIIDGFRRFKAIMGLRADNTKRFLELFPDGMVPCILDEDK